MHNRLIPKELPKTGDLPWLPWTIGHRVVGTNGSLTGYAGGIDRKIKLLTLEKADTNAFFIPKKGTAL